MAARCFGLAGAGAAGAEPSAPTCPVRVRRLSRRHRGWHDLPQTPVPDSLLLLPIELQAAALAGNRRSIARAHTDSAAARTQEVPLRQYCPSGPGRVWLSSTTVRAHDGVLWVSTNADAELRAELADGARPSVAARPSMHGSRFQVGADWTVKPDIELTIAGCRRRARGLGIDVGLTAPADRAATAARSTRTAGPSRSGPATCPRAEQWWMRLQQLIVLSMNHRCGCRWIRPAFIGSRRAPTTRACSCCWRQAEIATGAWTRA